jgi:parallel beta-helix repeat protein
MSFGGPDAQVMHDALKYAYDHGVLLVASAGNAGDDIKHYPAAYDEVIAVTATDLSDNLASFSSFGDWVEVAAPGVGIYSTVLSNSYREMSGTSMACPHVSGVAGLVWSAFPNYTNRQVRQLLRYSADDLGNWGFDVYYGYGRVNARRAVIGVPAHDLGLISRDYPNRIDPGQLATFNTTLANFGKNDEADITVELLVNGTVADAKTIDFMEAGVYASVSLQWGTTIVGAYNVTYYVVPVAGEDYVTNNFVSVNVSVRFPTILKVPDEYSTIKLALNSAGDGDTVLVNEGNYNESSIEILTDSITLMANGTVILDNLHLRDALNIRADNVVVSGFTIKNVDLDHCGIRMKGHNNSITNNTVIGTLDIYPMTGILAYNSTNCNISGNSIIGAFNGGVILTYSSNNTITQNKVTFSNWEFGIVLSNSSYNNVTFNTVTKCTYNGGGIHIVNSNWNFIASNNLNESRTGIILEFSGQNVLRNNNMTNNEANFGFASPEIQPLECLLNDIGTSNTVNGKPICYWINVSNAVVPENTGYVALIRCDNITVQNLTLKNNMQGVLMLLTNNTLITHNIITENNDEILFPSAVNARYCFNIVVNENELTNNKYGIMLNDCSNGTINMNNMTNGAFSGAYLMYSTNITLSRNDISSTYQCLEMYGSSNNLIIANNMTGGSYYTLAFSSSSENVFSSNNIVNAGVLIVMWESENRWDDGYPTGGNFWSNYAGADFYRGPHQNETGSDGIGDAPFTIDQNNTDAYPLKKPYRGPYDVGITTIAALKNQAYQNKSLNVTINIINYGVGDENLNIIIYAWPYPIAVFGGILSARNSGSFSFRCNLTGVPCGRYALKAVVSAVAGETDTSDNSVVGNTVTITILGDVNGDLVVNISDATQLSLYWQQLAPPAPVNVDINGDGVVDIRDATLIGVNWQKHA